MDHREIIENMQIDMSSYVSILMDSNRNIYRGDQYSCEMIKFNHMDKSKACYSEILIAQSRMLFIQGHYWQKKIY